MDVFFNIRTKYSTNTVDQDVQSMLLPLNIIYPKYNIKRNVVSPNSRITNFVAMIVTLLFMISFIHYNYMAWHKVNPKYSYVLSGFNCIFYCFGFFMTFLTGIIQSKNLVQFVLTFQKVHRFLNNEISFDHFVIWNWILLIVALGVYAIFLIIFCTLLNIPFNFIFICYCLVVFDLNTIYSTRLLNLLETKVHLWNIQVLNSQEIEDTHKENYSKEVFQAYVNILECYDIHKVCSQEFILYYIIEVFIHSLAHIQQAIDLWSSREHSKVANLALVLTYLWLLKSLLWQTMLTDQCDKFYSAMQSVQDSCAIILKSTCSEYEKKLGKNVLRLHRASFKKIRVCGLFYVDAALQLSLMRLCANYTIVLLQFEFL